MDQELIAYLDKRFDRVDKRFEQMEGAIREVGVEVESLRGQIQQVAEGVAANNENLASFRAEVYEKFDEMRQMFNTSHSNLHSRVSSLEAWREKVDPSPSAARKRRT